MTPKDSSLRPAGRNLLPTTLAQSIALLLLAGLGGKVVGFVRTVLTCRLLPQEELGRWDLAYGFILLAAPAVLLGVPGSLGRYLELFARRGALRRMLRYLLLSIGLLSVAVVAALLYWSEAFAWLIVRLPGQEAFVLWVGLALGGSLWFFTVQEIWGGLRRFQLVAALQGLHTLSFALLSLGLLYAWRRQALAVLAGYTAACLLCALVGLWWLQRTWPLLPEDRSRGTAPALWKRMIRFALWVWLTNWLTNLFQVIDRYMLVHLSRRDPQVVLGQVGNYHAAWILPLVLVAAGAVVHSALVPHLSHDWEGGRRARVRRILRRSVRLGSLGLMVALSGMQVLGPLLYGWFLQHRYPLAGELLPWVAVLAAWGVLATLVGCYLWCTEQVGKETAAMAIALGANALLNALLIPSWELRGAVAATAGGHLVLLGCVVWFAQRQGLGLSRSEVLLLLAPGVLLLGTSWLLLATAALVAEAVLGGRVFFTWQDRRFAFAWAARTVARLSGKKGGGKLSCPCQSPGVVPVSDPSPSAKVAPTAGKAAPAGKG